MSEKRHKGGRFTERPEGAAPLFDPKSGRKAALKRWDDQRVRNQRMLVRTIAKRLEIDPEDLTYEEALEEGILGPLFIEAMIERKSAAIKLALQMLGEMPDGADAKVHIDKRQLTVKTISFESPQAAQSYIEDQRSQGNFKQAAEVEEVLSGDIIEGDAIEVNITFDDSD